MAKKHLYYNEAERLYVVEQCPLSEIASRLRVSEKTLRAWKEEGNWDKKRLQFLQQKQSFSEELFTFAKKLARSIMDDWDKGERVDPGRLYAFTRLLPLIFKTKDFETKLSERKEEINIEELIKKSLAEAFGET